MPDMDNRRLLPSSPTGALSPLSWLIRQTITDFCLDEGAADLPPISPTPNQVVVSQSEGPYRTIASALAVVADGGRILLRPGIYPESLHIERPVDIMGDGTPDQIVIESNELTTLLLACERTTIQGITLRNFSTREAGQSAAIEVQQGLLSIIDCDITAVKKSCISVHGAQSSITVKNSSIHDSPDVGIVFWDKASGKVEFCTIVHHGKAGIAILQGSDPAVTATTFSRCQRGIFVSGGAGTVDRCTINDNEGTGIEITQAGTPLITGSSISQNAEHGLLIHSGGRGRVIDCEIAHNTKAGVVIASEGEVCVTRSRIHNGQQEGVLIGGLGRGRFLHCRIFANAASGVEIREGGQADLYGCRLSNGKGHGIYIGPAGSANIDDCDIEGHMQANVGLHEPATTTIRGCRLTGGSLGGLYATGSAQADVLVEGCTFMQSGGVGLLIRAGAAIMVRGTRFIDCKQDAVYIANNGQATFTDCLIERTAHTAVMITSGGRAKFSAVQVYQGKGLGLSIHSRGHGTLIESTIERNGGAGVEIGHGGEIKMDHCRIRHNAGAGVIVGREGRGEFVECEVAHNRGGAWQLSAGSAVTKQESDRK